MNRRFYQNDSVVNIYFWKMAPSKSLFSMFYSQLKFCTISLERKKREYLKRTP